MSAVEVNVREPESVARMVERVGNEHGRLDILVNNAAGNFYAPSATLSPNGWRAVVETDLYGTFFCCQAVYPADEGTGRRTDHLDLDDAALSRLAADGPRHGGQGRGGRAHPYAGAGVGQGPDHRQRRGSRTDPHRGGQKSFTPPGSDAPDLFGMEKYAADAIPLGRWGTPEDIGQMVTYLREPRRRLDHRRDHGGGWGRVAGRRGSGGAGKGIRESLMLDSGFVCPQVVQPHPPRRTV